MTSRVFVPGRCLRLVMVPPHPGVWEEKHLVHVKWGHTWGCILPLRVWQCAENGPLLPLDSQPWWRPPVSQIGLATGMAALLCGTARDVGQQLISLRFGARVR